MMESGRSCHTGVPCPKRVLQKYEYVYDEYYDCYICPNNQVLSYRTTNRDGYREYKSCGTVIWEAYMETCEDIRHTLGMKELYSLRKETIERVFARQRRIMDSGIHRCLEKPGWK